MNRLLAAAGLALMLTPGLGLAAPENYFQGTNSAGLAVLENVILEDVNVWLEGENSLFIYADNVLPAEKLDLEAYAEQFSENELAALRLAPRQRFSLNASVSRVRLASDDRTPILELVAARTRSFRISVTATMVPASADAVAAYKAGTRVRLTCSSIRKAGSGLELRDCLDADDLERKASAAAVAEITGWMRTGSSPSFRARPGGEHSNWQTYLAGLYALGAHAAPT